jgi:DNA polymerase III subunit gamma/tau
MGQALYRKYRSKSLSEIVGQEHITNALSQALAADRVSHAYLFTGPRGIGKTSIARIVAHEVNKLPYDESATHLDIIEIDAASNRRIDEIRDLREKVHIAPTSATYKVYIIDEVHMLTREAFNALLKTLEEPPAHVIFILATTEVHKLPETIISRTQHFAFKPIEVEQVVKHLSDIAKQEKINIDTSALKLIAEHGGGSFRDSISLLDQVRNSSSDTITLEDVQAMLGITSDEIVTTILAAVTAKNPKQLLITLQSLQAGGANASTLAKQVSQMIRKSIVNDDAVRPQEMLKLLESMIDVPTSADPFAALEVRLLQATLEGQPIITATPQASESPTTEDKPQPKETPKPKPKTPAKEIEKKETKAEPEPPTTDEAQKPKKSSSKQITAERWPEVINEIKHTYNTLYGVLRMAQPSFDDTSVTLTLAFAFHQKRLNEPKNKQIIADAIEKVANAHPEIICVVGSATPPETQAKEKPLPDVPDTSPGPNSLGTISNIFGGGELLES